MGRACLRTRTLLRMFRRLVGRRTAIIGILPPLLRTLLLLLLGFLGGMLRRTLASRGVLELERMRV